MSDYLKIAVEDPPRADANEITRRLVDFNRRTANRPEPQRFSVVLRDASGALRGGINAILHWDVLFIDEFWVDQDLQKQNLGSRIIAAAEREGQRRGANVAYLDTFSWQARPFYEKNGYAVFGEVPYANGEHKRFFMSKKLEQ